MPQAQKDKIRAALIAMGHNVRPIEERFEEKVDRNHPSGCHQWIGTLRNDGYGTIIFKRKLYGAHRMAFMLAGIDIPKGKVVDHICKNIRCVNLAHLRIVDPGVNSLENNNSPFAKNKRKTHCLQGHSYSGPDVAILRKPNASKRYKSMVTVRICLICRPSYRNNPWRIA